MANDVRIRLTDVEKTQSLDSVFVNDGSKLRQMKKSQLGKLLNTDGVVESAEGTKILLEDSANLAFQGMNLFGKSTQRNTTGKNLIQNIIYNLQYNGITITKNDDMSFYVNGTATDNCYFTINSGVSLPEGRYKLTGCDANGSTSTYVLYGTNDDFYTQDVGKGSVFNYTSELALPIRFAVYKGAVMKNVLIKPMLRLAEIEDDTYEPYSGGVASPSPAYPQEIKSVGQENGSITIDVYSGNLIPYPYNGLNNDKSEEEVKWTINADRSISVSGTPTAQRYYALVLQYKLPKGFYTLSGCPKGGEYQKYWMYVERKSDGYVWYEVGNGVTFEVTEEGIFDIVVNVGANAGTISNLTFYPMLNIGTEIKPYDSYTAQKMVLSVDNGLPGIPVTSGGNYIDPDGQRWICDEIDLERGVYIQRIKEIVLDGTESWVKNDEADATKYLYFLRVNDIGSNNCMCDKLAMKSSNTLNKSGNSYDYMGILTQSSYQVIYLNLNMYMTENTASELKSILQANPLTVLYPLLKPIETALTDEELEAYRSAVTNYPVTTVMTDAGWMSLKYNVDLKTFLHDFMTAVIGVKATVTLTAADWVMSDNGYYYTQEITIPNTNANSKIDLQPSPEQMIELLQSEISLFVSNNNGTILVYALNAVPDEDMTFDAIVTEVMAV